MWQSLSNSERGFIYLDINDEKQIQKILSRLPQQTLHQRKIASWIVVLQFWAELAEKNGISPESLAEKELILRDDDGRILTYPLTPEKNLWQYYQV